MRQLRDIMLSRIAPLIVLTGLAGSAISRLAPAPRLDALHHALGLLDEGHYEQADLAATALATHPAQPMARAWLVAASARRRDKRYEQAIEAYRRYLSLNCCGEKERAFVADRINACRQAQQPADAHEAPSRRLSDPQRRLFETVSDKTYIETSEHFVVRARNPHLAKYLLAQAERFLTRIRTAILPGQEYAHQVDIYVWPDRTAFLANAKDAPEWSGGSFAIHVDSGSVQRRIDLTQLDADGRFDRVMVDRVLPHEMCHLVAHEFFGEAGCPLFLDEGLAMLAESEADVDRTVLAGTALAGEGKIPLQDLLVLNPMDIQADPRLFYAESFSFLEFLRARLSDPQFKDMLHHVKHGCSVSDALQRALYVPPSRTFLVELADAWEEHAIAEAQIVRALTQR